MPYPIQWLDETFTSRSRAEELLRPDLDSGLINQHDFELATVFLPSSRSQRFNQFIYAITASTAVAWYGRLHLKPSWSTRKTVFLASSTGLIGSFYGQLRRAKAHWDFGQQLENPNGFSQALENVNRRTGGTEPLGWALRRAQEIHKDVTQADVHGDVSQPVEVSWEQDGGQAAPSDGAARQKLRVLEEASNENARHPSSRWEELRAANARNAGKSSSWDALRQNHERQQVPDHIQTASSPETDDRVRAQAEFDAVVEAERRLSRG
ncbi:hypothetical protein A0H81_00959 [Grifola frondosa]|uniref:Uncharacterized protein n=1 Tax=Grifola frondosa TaxID=5627 RepID=A0A1C7MT69_GRIFR|nr:hypothetical protein A0H81_00959 [Grifola frondosa]